MSHDSTSEHEMTKPGSVDPATTSMHMTNFKSPDSTATLLSSSEVDETSRTPSTPNSPKIRDFLRHTRLQILGKIFGRFTAGGFRQEHRKVVIYRNHRVAAFHCLLHMIPLGGAITLLLLRWTHYWIGHNSPDATILQFVAKFHELLMQVSIVEIMLCIIRSEAIRGFVPLGALSGAVQATQLSYLWSLDFLSIFTSDAFRGRFWSKMGMIIAIPALIVLTALVGPSSAVLMIPEPGCSKLGDPVGIFMAPNESLYPTYLDSGNGLNMNMASLKPTLQRFKIGSLTPGYHDDRAYPDPSNHERTLRLSVRRSALDTQTTLAGGRLLRWSTEEATSIEPTSFANNVLARSANIDLYSRGIQHNGTTSIMLPHPVTRVTCTTPPEDTRLGPNDELYYVNTDGSSLESLGIISSMARRLNGSGVFDYDTNRPYDLGVLGLGVLGDGWRYQRFAPIWLNAPDSDSPASIVVLFSWLTNATELQPLDGLLTRANVTSNRMALKIVTCRVSAHWNTVQASSIWNQGLHVTTETGPIVELEPRDVRDISLNTTGIDMLRDPEFARTMSYLPSVDLAVAFGLTISNLPALDTLKRIDSTWDDDRKQLGYDWEQWGNKFVEFEESFKVSDMWLVRYAYGYTTDSTSVRLALTVILAYCIVTVAYLVYILVTGSTSTAWNSAIELVALALQSKKPDYSGCTAVGIDSLDTFNQGVGIRVNSNDELELVFASDRDVDKRGLRRIVKNVAY